MGNGAVQLMRPVCTMGKKFESIQRTDFFKESCREKRVLHLGCTSSPYTEISIEKEMLLHFELEKIAGELHGIDHDKDGLEILRKNGAKDIFWADLENLDQLEMDQTFDVIVAGDMIEHLSNPGLFLDGIQRFMNGETKLIITTVNAYCAVRFAIYVLRGKGGRREPVHPDHVAYYSYRTLNLIVARANLEVHDFYFYDVGNEYRPTNNKIANLINDISVKISPHLSDGVIAVCKKVKEEIVD